MANPRWELKGDKYRRKYQVTVPAEITSAVSLGQVSEPQTYVLDFSELDGKYVELSLFRGIEGLIFLTFYAKDLISKKLKTQDIHSLQKAQIVPAS